MVLLKTLCFDLVIEHPYDSILKICKDLKTPEGILSLSLLGALVTNISPFIIIIFSFLFFCVQRQEADPGPVCVEFCE